ncbi:MAG: NAD-dependent dehydratase [Actinobacteria bacterium 13_2_20CM_2_71_6]|nr:MAG: NAD-dependent dehydratase [Actinobacteria bacterium 13_2_20CM_2_71_6]
MGKLLRPLLRRDDRILRLADVADIDDAQPGEEVVNVDVLDPEAVTKACQDVHAVLHLGGISMEAPFEDVLQVNVVGTHNVLRAVVDAGVPKVLLASSNHAVGFYRRSDVPEGSDGLPGDLPPRPDTFYGWSKAAIEALGALYHQRFGLDITVLRIGTCFAEPADTRALSTWLAPADAAQLIETCIALPDKDFRIIWAVSDNTRRWWSLADARALGYAPHDDAERFAADRVARFGEPDLSDPVHDLVGGAFCIAPLGEKMS